MARNMLVFFQTIKQIFLEPDVMDNKPCATRNMLIRKTFAVMVMAATGFVSVGAQADMSTGIVDQWDLGVVGQFLCGTAVATGSGPFTCAATTMNWGNN